MNKFDDVLKMVQDNSPASTNKQHIKMANHIINIHNKTNESYERIWLNEDYWENGY